MQILILFEYLIQGYIYIKWLKAKVQAIEDHEHLWLIYIFWNYNYERHEINQVKAGSPHGDIQYVVLSGW